MPRQQRVGIIDGGISGLALAASLTRFGIESHVFERTTAFSEVGAGIQMTPNAVKIMRDLGLLLSTLPDGAGVLAADALW